MTVSRVPLPCAVVLVVTFGCAAVTPANTPAGAKAAERLSVLVRALPAIINRQPSMAASEGFQPATKRTGGFWLSLAERTHSPPIPEAAGSGRQFQSKVAAR